MGDMKQDALQEKARQEGKAETVEPCERPSWETPKMEDISQQVMAQPYIRFT